MGKMIPSPKGNSPAAIAGRVARVVKATNQWKVGCGRWSRKRLSKHVKHMQNEARKAPHEFHFWHGVLRLRESDA